MRKFEVFVTIFSYLRNNKPVLLGLLLVVLYFKGISQNVPINDSIYAFKAKNLSDQPIKRTTLSSLRFFKSPDSRINFGTTGTEYYCILLKVSSSRQVNNKYLLIDNTSLDTVRTYQVSEDGKLKLLYLGGELVHFDTKRNYVWHSVPLKIDTNPCYYLIALKAEHENINVNYEILDNNLLQRKYQAYERLVFFYLGIGSLLTAIILLAFILFKRLVFAIYLGYMLCVFGWILSHYGQIFPYLYPNTPIINEIAKPLSSLGVCVFLILVLNKVFKQRLQSHRALRLALKSILYAVVALIASMILLLIPAFNTHFKFKLMVAWQSELIISAFIIVLTPLYFFKFDLTAKIFSLAMFVITLMAMMQLFGNLGYIDNFFINEHGMAMGSILEICIMAFALFHNLLEERKYKERQVITLENEQSETLKKLINVQDNERKRIAADLHDNIGPLLAALKINFRRIVNTRESDACGGLVAKTESIIDDSIAEIRNVAHNLMPKSLSSNGLINTLNEYFEEIQQVYNKTIVFSHQIESILNCDVQMNVYRIICELVLNGAKHSNARLITVQITSSTKTICILINDDGQGFQLKLSEHKKSLGLQSAESRVLYLKGKFILKTNPGEGTAITMEIPLQLDEAYVSSF